MKWKFQTCGEYEEKRNAKIGSWHRWFAWHPVTIDTGRAAWLETVERRGKYTFLGFGHDLTTWEYRESQ